VNHFNVSKIPANISAGQFQADGVLIMLGCERIDTIDVPSPVVMSGSECFRINYIATHPSAAILIFAMPTKL